MAIYPGHPFRLAEWLRLSQHLLGRNSRIEYHIALDKGEDGTAALADLAGTNAAAYAQHSETFGAYVNIVGANGRTLWASWLAGFDPANPDCGELEVSIAVTNGVPFLSWTPDLGVARTYTIWGHRDLSPTNGWETLLKDSLGASPNHFFKISVSQP